MNPKQKKNRKKQLLAKYGNKCWWCCESFDEKDLTLDHLLPKSKGGSDCLENLRLACLECNQERGNSLFPPSRCVKRK
ncbi:HNH endonuclease [Spirulina sp. 06S082]|uniref:HNH endonuclease n=1 Tax=Spirulina sp. 06S082 TaxID=3110248 RepID=UPI002B1FF154|nr:HNH endonuclease [Spirulina sp. 06S082]MEA5467916.1 HNH endonuclease [Spirulina sp. 06S082]